MNIKFHSSVIFVSDITISKDFYCKILHQEIENDFGNNVSLKCGISLWQVPDWHHLNNSFYQKGNVNKAFEIYFETLDFDATINILLSNQIKIAHNVIEESWGQKTIRIYDPDNNLIEIGESLETFIKRMFAQGMLKDQIVQKTGVPIEKIDQILA